MNAHAMYAPDPHHPVARRIRAARAYAGKSREEVGRAVGLGGVQIGRYERGQWKDEPPIISVRQGIARACGVPEWFLEEGFRQPEAAADVPRLPALDPPPAGEARPPSAEAQ